MEDLTSGEAAAGVSDKIGALVRVAQVEANHPDNPRRLGILRDAGLGEGEVRQAVGVVALYRMINTWTDLLAVPVDKL